MKSVKLLQRWSHRSGNHEPFTVVEVPDAVAEQLVAEGYAEHVEESESHESGPETAVRATGNREKAVKGRKAVK